MAHYFMDISRDDDNAILSVVVGCEKCAIRNVYTDYPDAKAWVNGHINTSHSKSESMAIKQIGDAARVYVKVGHKDRAVPVSYTRNERPVTENALALIKEHTTLGTQEFADLAGAKYNTAYQLLNRMEAEGLVVRVKSGRNTFWQATDGPREALPESE